MKLTFASKKTLPLLPCLFLLLLSLLFLNGCGVRQDLPQAFEGVIDLTRWNFEKQGRIHLDGQWEFYWNRLLEPTDFSPHHPSVPSAYMFLPGFWNLQKIDGKKLPRHGFATYRLFIRLPEGRSALALKLLDIHSAYRLWINGELKAEVGKVGTDRSNTVPYHNIRIIDIPHTAGELEVVLQVAGFHHYMSGVADRIALGRKHSLLRNQKITSGLILFVVGSLFIMGVYHLVLFVLRPGDFSPLYFGITCLIFSLWQMTMNPEERFLAILFPSLTWVMVYKIGFLLFILSIPAMLLFFQSLFPQESSRNVVRIFKINALVFFMGVILPPGHLFFYTVPVYELVTMMSIVYVIYVLVRAVRQKRDGAYFLLSGFAVLLLIVINDFLYDYRIIHTGYFIPWAIFILIISQSFVISLRFSKAFISVEKLSQELEEKNIALSRLDRLKDEFLAKTSHELRTPLNGIIGIAESLVGGIGGKISQATASNLSMIVSSGRRLANLVNDILDFSRLKNKDIALHTRPIHMNALVDMVLAVSRPLAAGKQVELINAVPEDSPPVLGDEDRLQQVMFNLIGNAVKFTDQGEIRVSAVLRDSFLETGVSDTGMGIPRDKIKDIFQSFEQVDASDARAFGGTGLGLSITRQLVELHGGHITVESEQGKGSSFRFTIPLRNGGAGTDFLPKDSVAVNTPVFFPLPDAVPELPEPVLPDRDTHFRGQARVLAVDDDPVNLRVVTNHLAFMNISVSTCTSGMAALEKIETGEIPDLVLLDIMMPQMTGHEVCRKLRTSFSSSELPIIMLTAKNLVTDLVHGFESGANDYLVKPFTKDELIARVRIHLKLRQAFHTLRENLSLKNELQERKQTIQALRMLQRRLAEILNRVEDSLIAVNESNEISFCNESCERFLGYGHGDLLGQPLSFILPEAAGALITAIKADDGRAQRLPGQMGEFDKVRFQRADEDTILADVRLAPLDLEEESFTLLILREPAGTREGKASEQVSAFKLVEELNRNRVRIQTLEGSLNRLFHKNPGEHPRLINELRVMDNALEGLSRAICGDDAPEDRRRLALEVMNLALEYWTEATGSTKIEMARRSQLWKVYTNRDGWQRAQTLDKYLAQGDFPKRPRWDRIIRTADFVLASCEKTSPIRDRLELALERLRGLV